MSSHDPSPEVRAVHQVGALAGHHAGQGASARIGAGHGHEHASTEGFPRFEVRDLIGDSLAATRQRELWQDAVVTLGLCLVALALPTYRLLGDGPSLVSTTARGSWSSLHLGLQPFAQLISKLPSIGPERAWFLIAAVCWSATYPVLSRMNLALGMSRLASCTSALLVLAAPLSFLSATLPGPSAPALLGSAILFSSLLTSANRGANAKRSTGPLGTWFAVCLLDPNLVMTLPAVIWHSFSMPDGRPTPWPARWRTILGATTGLLVLTALGCGCSFRKTKSS